MGFVEQTRQWGLKKAQLVIDSVRQIRRTRCPKLRGLYAFPIILLSLFLYSCGNSDQGSIQLPGSRQAQGAVSNHSLNVTINSASQSSSSVSIGKEGGTVSAAYNGITYTLTIPPDAVENAQTITMTPLSAISGSPLDSGFAAGVNLSPDGLVLYKPATLTIEMPAGGSGAVLVGFGYAHAGSGFHLTPISEAGGVITIQVNHFSGVGVAEATPETLATVTDTIPSSGSDSYQQQIALIMANARSQILNGAPEAATMDAALAQIGVILNNWLVNNVLPNLQTAVNVPDLRRQAVGDALAWDRTNQQLGFSGVTDSRITAGIRQIFLRVQQEVLVQLQNALSDPLALGRDALAAAFSMQRELSLLGLESDEDPRIQEYIFQILQKAVDAAGALCLQDRTKTGDVLRYAGQLAMLGGPDVTAHAEALVAKCSGAVPQSIDVVSVTPLDGAVTISWNTPADWADSMSPNWATAATVSSSDFANDGYTIYFDAGMSATLRSRKDTGSSRTQTSYTITNLQNDMQYCFAVTQTKLIIGESVRLGAQKCATPRPKAPATPTNVAAMPGNASNALKWNSSTGAASYNIYWMASPGVTQSSAFKLAGVASPYSHLGLTNGRQYCYVVTAVNSGGESAPSTEVCSTPRLTGCTDRNATNYNPNATIDNGSCVYSSKTLPAPTGVSTVPGVATVAVSWNRVAGATSYVIVGKRGPGVSFALGGYEVTKTVASTLSSYTFSLGSASQYCFAVKGYNMYGYGAQSQEVCATPLRPDTPTGLTVTASRGKTTIDWDPVPGATSYKLYLGGSSYGFNATPPYINSMSNSVARCFTVTAVVNNVESLKSQEVCGQVCPNSRSVNSLTSAEMPDDGLRLHCIPSWAGGLCADEVTTISCSGRMDPQYGINDLKGMEYFVGLTTLNLSWWFFPDVTPLSGLPLVTLDLHEGHITDASPLAKITTLKSLNLTFNYTQSCAGLTAVINALGTTVVTPNVVKPFSQVLDGVSSTYNCH